MSGDIPSGPDAPAVLTEHLLAYEADLRQHIATLRREVPAIGLLALHTTSRRAS